MSKKFGFTLAEVLITLGIIGVVAAMTMPTLMSNTQGAQFKTAFKKELSTLNQAVLMQFAMEDTDFSNLTTDDGTNANSGNGIMMSGILSSRLQAATDITTSYFNSYGTGADAKLTYTPRLVCTTADVSDTANTNCTSADDVTNHKTYNGTAVTFNATDSYVYSFADGTAFGYKKAVPTGGCSAKSSNCLGFLDVNGVTKPNQVTTCENVVKGTATTCEASEIHDIFPVIFYGQTMEAATESGRAILTNK